MTRALEFHTEPLSIAEARRGAIRTVDAVVAPPHSDFDATVHPPPSPPVKGGEIAPRLRSNPTTDFQVEISVNYG